MDKIYTSVDYSKALEKLRQIADAPKGTGDYEELILLEEAIKEYEESRSDWDMESFNE